MIYLWLKIIGYLFAALMLGGAAGWLLRNVTATRTEDQLRRRLAELSMRAQQRERQARVAQARRPTREAKEDDGQTTPAPSTSAANGEQQPTERQTLQRSADPRTAQQSNGEAGDLRAELAKITRGHQALADDLERERRRVGELEQERELQDRSLRLLHQQLELERERRLEATG